MALLPDGFLAPLYQANFHLMMNPYQEFSYVDLQFIRDFYHELDVDWILFDPRGKTHVVTFNRDLLDPRVTNGWSSVMYYYDLFGIHWENLKYIGHSMFDIKIFYDVYIEIEYPIPFPYMLPLDPIPPMNNVLDIDLNLPPNDVIDVPNVPIFDPLHMFNQYHPPLFYGVSHTTTLTEYKALSGQLCLPQFVSNYLRNWGAEPWTIRGPNGHARSVSLVAPPGERYARLGSGWQQLCDFHALVEGDIVTLNFTDGYDRIIDVSIIHLGT